MSLFAAVAGHWPAGYPLWGALPTCLYLFSGLMLTSLVLLVGILLTAEDGGGRL